LKNFFTDFYIAGPAPYDVLKMSLMKQNQNF